MKGIELIRELNLNDICRSSSDITLKTKLSMK